ncbi:MAG TPA: valine--tRNA ligase [Dongiaceae bacterium]|jgi:valyl-tRNA synthetase|nr:valine--tRNA ligase [Dongiaceae bacterium]
MLEKTFRPEAVESRQYERWEKAGAFSADERSNRLPYAIMMPPPNVTGSLHIGHALTFTLQDVLVRYQRMRGKDVLWQPGTDHAGIATQMVVERNLAREGLDRHALGREKFLERVWAWKEESGGTILGQLRRLGASADWSRERFTLDEGLSRAVTKVFVQLHREGLIYRDKRLVNWDPVLHTAISDLEVQQKETKGNLWHIAYDIADSDEKIVVATTRPETMLGDSGIAVHPEDERYQALVGKQALLPLVGRRLPIVADAYADPTKGTGAVKMTPAHDFNDFAVGKRHGLEMVNIFDRDARLIETVPAPFQGLDRMAARAAVLQALEAEGRIVHTEPIIHMVPHGDRSGAVIEPWLTDQWFADAASLARPAIEAVEQGKTRFVPQQWESTFFEWMRNIQPWCISRQLWWGHQIPAWYAPDGQVFVAHDEEEARRMAGPGMTLTRDPDVLDTWFSSALWPFSTLGWPEETAALKKYYPGDVLVTGFDIIFFWVARMMMMGIKFMGEVPFRDVYVHALVRDAEGQKMSKSKGNVVDPLVLMDKYGTDALRFTLTALAAQGRDIRMNEERVEGYRNFATKLWNAARFCEMNNCRVVPDFNPRHMMEPVNRWMAGRLVVLARELENAYAEYRFNDVAQFLYQAIWGEFCDWYLEFIKPVLQGEEGPARQESRAAAAWIFGQLLHLLHPVMPFLTEELWGQLQGDGMLIGASWPAYDDALFDQEADRDLGWVIRVIGEIRSLRAEMNVPPASMVQLFVAEPDAASHERIRRYATLLQRLARIEKVETSVPLPRGGAAQFVVDGLLYSIPLASLIDLRKERERLHGELARLLGEDEKIQKKLANPNFVAKADPDVVEEQRLRLASIEASRRKLTQALDRLA